MAVHDDPSSPALARRFAAINVKPLDGELREKLVRDVIEFGRYGLAPGVKMSKVTTTLRQKPFAAADMQSTLRMLREKGLLVEKSATVPKPR